MPARYRGPDRLRTRKAEGPGRWGGAAFRVILGGGVR
jgi:hypothetical protein